MDKEKKETRDNEWAKANGFVLKRDSCEKCMKVKGRNLFCSASHAYEVSQLKREQFFREKRERLLSAIDTQKLPLEEARILLNEIEEKYY